MMAHDLENFVGLGSVHMSPYVPMERQISSVEEWKGWNVKPRATLPLLLGSWSRHPDGGTVAAGRQRSALPLSPCPPLVSWGKCKRRGKRGLCGISPPYPR